MMTKRKWTKEEITAFRKEKGSYFYFNRDDLNLFVPKVYGLGWTLNFGNPFAWIVILAIVAFVVWTGFFK